MHRRPKSWTGGSHNVCRWSNKPLPSPEGHLGSWPTSQSPPLVCQYIQPHHWLPGPANYTRDRCSVIEEQADSETWYFSQRYVPVVVVLSLFELVNMPSLQKKFLFLYNKQRTADPASICVDPDLPLTNISDHWHLDHDENKIKVRCCTLNKRLNWSGAQVMSHLRHNDVHLSPQFPQCVHQLLWIFMNTHPATIHKNLSCTERRSTIILHYSIKI